MMPSEMIKLPLLTSRTTNGPKLSLPQSIPGPAVLVVDYDCEEDDGSVKWARLIFQDVLSFAWRVNACSTAEDLDADDQMVKYLDSDWLDEMRARWRGFLPFVREGEEFAYAHWRIHFDDTATVNVIARSFEIGHP